MLVGQWYKNNMLYIKDFLLVYMCRKKQHNACMPTVKNSCCGTTEHRVIKHAAVVTELGRGYWYSMKCVGGLSYVRIWPKEVRYLLRITRFRSHDTVRSCDSLSYGKKVITWHKCAPLFIDLLVINYHYWLTFLHNILGKCMLVWWH